MSIPTNLIKATDPTSTDQAIVVRGLPGTSLQRVELRMPTADGSYVANVSGATAAGAAAGVNLVSFRWGSATKLALIRQARLSILVSTASTVGLPEMAGYITRGFTVSDSVGTAVATAGNALKKRTSHATSVVTDFRFADGGALTAGTRTLEVRPFVVAYSPLALGTGQIGDAWGMTLNDDPIVLAQDEGLVFQNVTALTLGVYRYQLRLEWLEVTSY